MISDPGWGDVSNAVWNGPIVVIPAGHTPLGSMPDPAVLTEVPTFSLTMETPSVVNKVEMPPELHRH